MGRAQQGKARYAAAVAALGPGLLWLASAQAVTPSRTTAGVAVFPQAAPPAARVVQKRSPATGRAPAPATAFGYAPGESRRYVLGPPEALDPGEGAEWTLRFDGFEDTPDGWRADFGFTHERFERLLGTLVPAQQVMSVRVEGRLRTNLAGFPLWLEYTQEFIVDGERASDTSRRTVRYTWVPGEHRYDKTIKLGTRDWQFKVPVPNHRYVDLDVPRGIYLYLPGALSCLGDSRVTCVELEPALGDPGLLGFILGPLEEQSDSEREFAFFMPMGLRASPFSHATAGPWLSRERNRLASLDRYFDFVKVKLGTSGQVQVGPRTLHAWEVDMCCGIDRAWIEPDGRVLRVDLETTMTNPEKRWIRYVFPFEEFVTPNEDPARRCCR